MTPLTVDCARARQLLPEFHDGTLGDEDSRFVESHLDAGCAGCNESLLNLRSALSALSTLSAQDVEALRAADPAPVAAAAGPELDMRPLAMLTGLATAAVLLTLAGSALFRPAAQPAAPTSPVAQVQVAAPAFALPSVGGVVGIEEDPSLLLALTPSEPAAPAPEPQAVALAPAPVEPPAAVAPPAAEPDDAAVAPPAPKPDKADAKPDAPAKPPPPAPQAPPDDVLALLARLQVSKQGIGYRELGFYFVRDPAGRDRIGRARDATQPLVRESSPADPEAVVLRPPAGRSRWQVLAGELLDGPYGLRIAPASYPLTSRTAFEVIPVSFAGLDPRARRAYPLLKASALLPSKARHALLTDDQPGPVAVFLKLLDDPSLLELRRLQTLLAKIEPEARDLERRLRGQIRDVRGLRGIAVTIQARARAVDVFGSARTLSEALPTMIRTALLEAELEQEVQDGVTDLIDQPTKGFREVSVTQSLHAAAVGLLPKAQRLNGQRVYRVPDVDAGSAVVLAGDELLHAVVIPKP